ncbi:hypothetical protein SDC9_105873 [bioreactor metagenome]|uniref:Uncharacterized protein n=1 Tax=bioreactor metagenome TaxID=1076179 RepID=A0A645B0P1_9ZZZZ
MSRHGHHRPGAVVGQHVVGGVDRQLLVVDRVGRVTAEEDAGLGPLGGLPLDVGDPLGRLEVLLERGTLRGGADLIGQLGLGSDDEERGTEKGVGSGGEDGDRAVVALDGEVDVGALGAADPVALHGQYPVGPVALDLIHVVQQPLGVLGGPEVPLVELALGDQGAAPLAVALDDLLVGQHGLVIGAPVDHRVLAIGQAPLEEPEEQPLGPAVVLDVGGVQSPAPVDTQAVALEGAGLGLDVLVRPLGGVGVALDGGVLGGQAEGVPADRVHDVVAAQLPVAGDNVTHHEGLGVAHVQVTRRVGEHVEDVASLAGTVVEGHKGPILLPERLPALLSGHRVIRRHVLWHPAILAHGPSLPLPLLRG